MWCGLWRKKLAPCVPLTEDRTPVRGALQHHVVGDEGREAEVRVVVHACRHATLATRGPRRVIVVVVVVVAAGIARGAGGAGATGGVRCGARCGVWVWGRT